MIMGSEEQSDMGIVWINCDPVKVTWYLTTLVHPADPQF